MPSIKTITPLLGGSYYHIFNRGINKQRLFFQEKNYFYFLDLIKKYLIDYMDILSYCLLPNHFHLVVRVKDVIFLKDDILRQSSSKGLSKDDILRDEFQIGDLVTNQFRRLFIGYSMAINKQENRTGGLFDRPFKRLEITEHEYLQYAIFYTHFNPEKHGLSENFINYPFSSFMTFGSSAITNVNRKLVFEIFEGKESFFNYHKVMHAEREDVILE